MLTDQVYDSKLAVVDPTPQTALITHGEYSVHPMTTCSEEEVAVLFTKVCQRGNPVLQGRPFKDLLLLGRAMYRKCAKLGLGLISKHDGKIMGLGVAWDIAEGGVWAGSGLEMPTSLSAHAACGKACFDSLPKRGKKTLFAAFYGLLPSHHPTVFGIMAMCHFESAKKMGFEDTHQFTLLPNLKGRGVFGDTQTNEDSLNWSKKFTDVVSDKPEVLEELKELGGSIVLQLATLDYGVGDEYYQMAANTVRMKDPAELRKLVHVTSAAQLQFLRSFDFEWSQYVTPGNQQIPSKL